MSVRGNIRRALLMDAIRQVLDNRVFRILFVLSSIFVALTFVVGFREDSVWLFFGAQEYFYEDFFRWLPVDLTLGPERQRTAIELVQGLFASQIAGSFGILFCIAATAFFLPQLLEKGFADSFFSKPVSRWQLLLSRYVAALLLISFLAVFLVGGMYLGLLVASGYSDPGFLWSAPTLIYLFALVSGFTMLFGALTRSTVATLLLTFVAYGFTGLVHTAWTGIEAFKGNAAWAEMEKAHAEGRASDVEVVLGKALLGTVTTLHYVLPKTNDADYITANLRDRLVWGDYADDDGLVVVVEEDGERRQAEGGGGIPWANYEEQLSWTGPLATNLSFSIASSLAFVAAALGLAWLRIRRISF